MRQQSDVMKTIKNLQTNFNILAEIVLKSRNGTEEEENGNDIGQTSVIDTIRLLKEENEQLKTGNELKYTCKICMDRAGESCLIPCGHILCSECSQTATQTGNDSDASSDEDRCVCPFCHKQVQRFVRVYFI